jgi:hypothetical protein
MPRRPLPAPILSDEQEKLDREHAARRRDESRPFAPDALPDLGDRRDLARAQRRGLLGVLPQRSLWPELADHNERVHDLQQQHADAVARLQGLKDQRELAPDRDAEAMAQWIADGQKGSRPTSTVDTVDEAIKEAERHEAGAQLAYDRALEARADFVERNRDRLVKVAEQEKLREHERFLKLVDELEQSRANMLTLREAETWARFFPDEEASQRPYNEGCGPRGAG